MVDRFARSARMPASDGRKTGDGGGWIRSSDCSSRPDIPRCMEAARRVPSSGKARVYCRPTGNPPFRLRRAARAGTGSSDYPTGARRGRNGRIRTRTYSNLNGRYTNTERSSQRRAINAPEATGASDHRSAGRCARQRPARRGNPAPAGGSCGVARGREPIRGVVSLSGGS
eukprot:2267246-Prymnesium_polylepis.1